MTGGCLTDDQVALLIDASDHSDGRAAALAHLDGCGACRELVAGTARAAHDPSGARTPAHDATLPALASAAPITRGASVGRYVVMDFLGAGAMGVVYAAYDPELHRRVALKLIRANADGDTARSAVHQRLLREAQAMASLSHPSVLPVYDVGLFGDRVFVAMELVDGQTLGQWLQKERGWRDVLAVFLGAGRGLAAVHAAGVIHRDFKPDNVLVGNDGRVRVGDFGLARADAATPDPTKDASPEALTTLTHTGTLLGTPAYMAPEQLLLEPATAASDQFSFCVALHEGLYGRRPFAASSMSELKDVVLAGKVQDPPPASRVPAWLRAVVLRGLATRPEQRFPSLAALLRALEADPWVARRRILALAAAAAVLTAGGFALHASTASRPSPCTGAEGEIAAVWGPERQSAVRAALVSEGLPYGPAVAETFAQLLDTYARAWAAQRTEACEATRVQGTQSDELLDLRMDCLRQDREELRALADLFARPQAGLVDSAVKAATALPPLARCRAEAALRTRVPAPRDDQRAQVVELRGELATARALHGAGRFKESATEAATVVDAAKVLRYLPLEAEALEVKARAHVGAGDLQEGLTTYEASLRVSIAGGHDRVASDVMSGMVWTVGVQLDRRAEGMALADQAAALAERLADDTNAAEVLYYRGILLFEADDIAGAAESFGRSRALRVRLHGPVHPDVARLDNALGRVSNALGKFEEARDHYGRGVATLERLLGADHPLLGPTLGNMAQQEWEDFGDAYRARALAERALAIDLRRGPANPDAGFNRVLLGELAGVLGDVEGGIAQLEQARGKLEATLGPEHRFVAWADLHLGVLFAQLGRTGEALEHARRGLTTLVKLGGEGTDDSMEAGTLVARVLGQAGRFDEALAQVQHSLAVGAKARTDVPSVVRARGALCDLLVQAKHHAEALDVCREVSAAGQRVYGAAHPVTARALASLGVARLALGDARAAVPALEQAYAALATRPFDASLPGEVRAALARAVAAAR